VLFFSHRVSTLLSFHIFSFQIYKKADEPEDYVQGKSKKKKDRTKAKQSASNTSQGSSSSDHEVNVNASAASAAMASLSLSDVTGGKKENTSGTVVNGTDSYAKVVSKTFVFCCIVCTPTGYKIKKLNLCYSKSV
jgi:hypothetical protein